MTHEDDAEYWRQYERDYYVLLGVARTASAEEIRSRYLALSREFHPDRLRKRQDPALIAVANTQYPILDRAYKVLSDPTKRHVYDIYGERGVAALDQSELAGKTTTLGAHLQSSDEMQQQVEKMLRRMNQQALEAQFSSFSEMNMSVDASDFIHAPMRGLRSLFRGDRRLLERTDMTIHQRTTFPLSRSTKLTLGGYMYDKQGLGLGCFTSRLEYTSSDPSIPSCAISTELGWTPKLHCQFSQPVSPYTVLMWIPELDSHGLDMSFGVNQLLLPQLNGAMMWSTRDGLSASLAHDTQLAHQSLGVAVNRGGPNLSLQFRRALFAATMNVKASLRANLVTGLSLVVGGSKQLSQRTRVAMGVLLAKAGVTLRLGFTRGSVRFVMPIFLSPFSAQTAFSTFIAATTPFVISAVVTQLVQPAQERKRRRALEHRHEMRRHYLSSARRSALSQQQLMVRCADEKRQAEHQRTQRDGKGLVIILARYGKDPTNPDPMDATAATRVPQGSDSDDETPTESEPTRSVDDEADEATELARQWVDVTIPMQFFVQDSSVTLPASSKASLLGFYNPCAGDDSAQTEEPQLYVRYAYDSLVFEATFRDAQAVQLPSRYARVMGAAGHVY
ncbi:hypothetical protein Poli38472_007168 [Pythium oligandrum]|uniref:J domain-containing protein n=1 Tax=Pythium oligandrum TaxID=41045 RepID=A0A8K1FHR5_PYTOL|nr:hypothetical protein Poli38472_007168 [Pythium oligandrum]|eukprot:TMW59023.1 hypothetical protein Poli38472_007168 [Pythium oligandrum]